MTLLSGILVCRWTNYRLAPCENMKLGGGGGTGSVPVTDPGIGG